MTYQRMSSAHVCVCVCVRACVRACVCYGVIRFVLRLLHSFVPLSFKSCLKVLDLLVTWNVFDKQLTVVLFISQRYVFRKLMFIVVRQVSLTWRHDHCVSRWFTCDVIIAVNSHQTGESHVTSWSLCIVFRDENKVWGGQCVMETRCDEDKTYLE